MKCAGCNAENPDGAKYCCNCGTRLDLTSGPIKDILESTVRNEVDRALKGYLKDQKIAEYDITEKVANRLLGWGKIFATLFGALVVIGGVFGIKTVMDLSGFAQKAKKDLQANVQSVRKQIEGETNKLNRLTEENKKLDKTYANLSSKLPEYEKIDEEFTTLKQSIDEQDHKIGELDQQVKDLVTPQPVPKGPGTYPFRLPLHTQVGSDFFAEIQKSGKLVFHLTGDTGGVKDPNAQILVAAEMEKQFKLSNPSERPAFLYLLGNLVYFYGEAEEYYRQFYLPYQHYRAPIFAIPGNHAASVPKGKEDSSTSLAAFMANFCARTSQPTKESGDTGRPAMTQPNCYWTLETPLATIIGLYTNVLLDGSIDEAQKEWLVGELKAAPLDKALIVTMHASPYQETGARAGAQMLDEVSKNAGRAPDIVFSAHAHLYMRFTRRVEGRELPYVIIGTGGYFRLKRFRELEPEQFADVKREQYDDKHHGFAKVSITRQSILCEYFGVSEDSTLKSSSSTLLDRVEVDWISHRLISSNQ
jgi:acid phosphatase type 7